MKKLLSVLCGLLFSSFVFANSNLVFNEIYSTYDVNNLNITLSSEEIYFKTIHGDEITVEVYCNFDKKAPEVTLVGNTLDISRKAKQTISGINYQCSIYIYLPDNYKFNKSEITLTSGDCEIEDFMSSEAYFVLTSGNLKVEYLEVPTAKITTTSGDIRINEYRGQNLVSISTSGNFSMDSFKGESFSIETTSGNTFLNHIKCDYFDVIATSGNVTVRTSQMIQATSRIQTTSGNIDLTVPFDSDFELTVDTNSGVFNDKISDTKQTPRNGFYKAYNNGGSAFELITTSGNICLSD